MIWSVIPEEVVFKAGEKSSDLQLTEYLGRRVILRQGRVDSLLSTDPADFLDQRFMPGSLVNQRQ